MGLMMDVLIICTLLFLGVAAAAVWFFFVKKKPLPFAFSAKTSPAPPITQLAMPTQTTPPEVVWKSHEKVPVPVDIDTKTTMGLLTATGSSLSARWFDKIQEYTTQLELWEKHKAAPRPEAVLDYMKRNAQLLTDTESWRQDMERAFVDILKIIDEHCDTMGDALAEKDRQISLAREARYNDNKKLSKDYKDAVEAIEKKMQKRVDVLENQQSEYAQAAEHALELQASLTSLQKQQEELQGQYEASQDNYKIAQEEVKQLKAERTNLLAKLKNHISTAESERDEAALPAVLKPPLRVARPEKSAVGKKRRVKGKK